jgi:hypothetical protein
MHLERVDLRKQHRVEIKNKRTENKVKRVSWKHLLHAQACALKQPLQGTTEFLLLREFEVTT